MRVLLPLQKRLKRPMGLGIMAKFYHFLLLAIPIFVLGTIYDLVLVRQGDLRHYLLVNTLELSLFLSGMLTGYLLKNEVDK